MQNDLPHPTSAAGRKTGLRPLSRQAIEAENLCRSFESAGVGDLPSRPDLLKVVTAAARALGLRGPTLIILEKLASCYGQPVKGRVLVWPSNRRLMETTNLNETSIRREHRTLIRLGLMIAKDSPRRHRFAVRDRSGAIVDAYGFDLSPLWRRRAEFFATVAQQDDCARAIRHGDIELSRLKLQIQSAIDEATPFDRAGARLALLDRLASIGERTPRKGRPGDRTDALRDLAALRDDAEALFYSLTQTTDSNRLSDEYDRLSPSKTTAYKKSTEDSTEGYKSPTSDSPQDPEKLSAFGACSFALRKRGVGLRDGGQISPLLIASTCSEARESFGDLSSPADIERVGAMARAAFGASRDAWDEAINGLGEFVAAALAIYVFELATDNQKVKGPLPRTEAGKFGGLFRHLARQMCAGDYSLTPALQALRRKRMS